MAMLGKEVRMSRLVNPESKKMMAITVDHAISRGIAPMKGLQPIQETIEKIVMGRPDAMTMTKGIAEHCMWPFAGKVALLMKVSNYSPVSPTRDTIFGSVDEAVIAVMEATVPDPCATLNKTPIPNVRHNISIVEDCPSVSPAMRTSPIFVACITAPKAPPAPVISSTTPACFSDLLTDSLSPLQPILFSNMT